MCLYVCVPQCQGPGASVQDFNGSEKIYSPPCVGIVGGVLFDQTIKDRLHEPMRHPGFQTHDVFLHRCANATSDELYSTVIIHSRTSCWFVCLLITKIYFVIFIVVHSDLRATGSCSAGCPAIPESSANGALVGICGHTATPAHGSTKVYGKYLLDHNSLTRIPLPRQFISRFAGSDICIDV